MALRAFPRVLDYLDVYGLPWRVCRDMPHDWPVWNGQWLFILRGRRTSRMREMTSDLILHELAHWQLEAEYRHLPNYGLGPDPLEGGYGLRTRPGDGRREDLASVLTVCHARAYGGLSWREVSRDFGTDLPDVIPPFTTWPMFVRAHREFRELQRLGLVDEQGVVCRP